MSEGVRVGMRVWVSFGVSVGVSEGLRVGVSERVRVAPHSQPGDKARVRAASLERRSG